MWIYIYILVSSFVAMYQMTDLLQKENTSKRTCPYCNDTLTDLYGYMYFIFTDAMNRMKSPLHYLLNENCTGITELLPTANYWMKYWTIPWSKAVNEMPIGLTELPGIPWCSVCIWSESTHLWLLIRVCWIIFPHLIHKCQMLLFLL